MPKFITALIYTLLDTIILTAWLAFTLNVGVVFGCCILACGLLARHLCSAYLPNRCSSCYDADEEDT